MFDATKIEKIAPEYWRNSQLSVARHYGGAIVQGKRYVIDPVTDYLVREDVFKAEKRAAKRTKQEGNQDALQMRMWP